MLVRRPMTNFKMTVKAECAVLTCSTFPPSIKALVLWLSVADSQLLNMSLPFLPTPPYPWKLPSKIKQTSLSTNLASFLTLEDQTPESHFWFQDHIEVTWTRVQAEDPGECHPQQLNMYVGKALQWFQTQSSSGCKCPSNPKGEPPGWALWEL